MILQELGGLNFMETWDFPALYCIVILKGEKFSQKQKEDENRVSA